MPKKANTAKRFAIWFGILVGALIVGKLLGYWGVSVEIIREFIYGVILVLVLSPLVLAIRSRRKR
jgi:hypothetical protein